MALREWNFCQYLVPVTPSYHCSQMIFVVCSMSPFTPRMNVVSLEGRSQCNVCGFVIFVGWCTMFDALFCWADGSRLLVEIMKLKGKSPFHLSVVWSTFSAWQMELLSAFKKQLKLIDVLKRQKVGLSPKMHPSHRLRRLKHAYSCI